MQSSTELEKKNIEKLDQIVQQDYKYGFVSNIESEKFPKGLNEEVVRLISQKKKEPKFMLEFRLKAFEHWKKMKEPSWSEVSYPKIDYQEITYYSAPKVEKKLESLDQVDPELLETYEKLGIPISEQKRLSGVAVDAIFDSVSIATTYKDKLLEHGVIFCPISEALEKYPELVKKYLGSVIPYSDNYFAALNSAVFSDGSFCYIPKNTICPMELSSYFRINTEGSGQFERTLVICEENSYVSYLEGCTAPAFDTNQLHAAVVELVALDQSEIKYSTVQNWYAGDPKTGKGGVYNFVTKRGKCLGKSSKISWTQIETGSAITWKYPSCLLLGDNSVGEFYSVALTNHHQQADTGTKMIHIGANTKSTIISKGISAGKSSNTYRGLVKVGPNAERARNYSQCDSMLIGQESTASTLPYVVNERLDSSCLEHEASTSKVGVDQLFYLQQRGISEEQAIKLIVGGFCGKVLEKLPQEFAAEANSLLGLKLENSVG